MLSIKPGTTWAEVYASARSLAPEAFDADRLRNLVAGDWTRAGIPGGHFSPVDGRRFRARRGSTMTKRSSPSMPPRSSTPTGRASTSTSGRRAWPVPSPRCASPARRSRSCSHGRSASRGASPSPTSTAASTASTGTSPRSSGRSPGARRCPARCRTSPRGNYPLSVQVHAELVQALAGNAVIAKTPSQGGFHALTLAHAIMRRHGLPVTLVSGVGADLSDALIRSPEIGALAFVGGRSNGRKAAVTLADTGKRHVLEQEGLNAWGRVELLRLGHARGLREEGFEYAKQRCTAYPRYVVQRHLFPAFLEMYLPVLHSLRFGHPLAVESPDDDLPELDFGPLIHAAKAQELRDHYDAAVAGGAIPLFRGSLSDGRFIEGQDTSAYLPPSAVLAPRAVVGAPPRGALRAARLRRGRRHAERAPRRDERLERQPRLVDRDRRHRRSAASSPSSSRPSRSASIARARAATARRSSAGAARRGPARSSAATSSWPR